MDRSGKVKKIWSIWLDVLFSTIFEGFFVILLIAAFLSVILYSDLTFE